MTASRKRRKRIVLLGSTGSIGRSTLEVVNNLGPEFEVLALSTNENWQLLLKQIEQFHPRRVAIASDRAASEIMNETLPDNTEIFYGTRGLQQLASDPAADVVVLAISGCAALPAAVAAIRAGKTLALANKEVLVMAGEIVVGMARKCGAKIIPLDSEHNAVHQLLRTGRRDEVKRIVLTASGGPFYDWPDSKLRKVTLEQALRHPTWRMGQQITINSATMINKAMEVVEAHWLFGLDATQIDILVHPEAIVHSIVEFHDGSCFAVIAPPDMRVPIQYVLTEPRRMPAPHIGVDLASTGTLSFKLPNTDKFPALSLGYDVLRQGGTLGAALCGANEVAVKAFVKGSISFPEIVDIVRRVMKRHVSIPNPTLEQIIAVDRWAAREAERLT